MNEIKIYQKIKELAEKLNRSGMTLTRTDLAYEIKELGVKDDSLSVSEWVWKTYIHYKKDGKIRTAFVNNEKRRYIVDEYSVYSLTEQGNVEDLSKTLDKLLTEGDSALRTLENCISAALSNEAVAKSAGGLMATVTGTKGVVDVQAKAASVFERYTQMVNAYDTAKGDVKAIIGDFVSLRNYVSEIYCKYVLALTDVFGDSIKAVSPNLFDFDSIQYLDVQTMLKNVQLEYNQVMDRCGELMSSISDSFSNSLNASSGIYRQTGNKKVGLMMAGIEMINHYMNAAQKTNELRGQLVSLENNVRHDATQIKGDMGRLMLIYKGMNDLHIPRAEAFYKYSRQVLESDFSQLMESLYNTPELSALMHERESLLEQYKELNRAIADSQLNIEYYTSHIAECETLIKSMEPRYMEAKESKPSKPFFLLNIITLGSSSKKYNREISEWYHSCQPVIKQYEDFKVDVNLDRNDLTIHQKTYDECSSKLKEISMKLKRSSRSMMQAINVDAKTKRQIAGQLDTLIKLLRVAKEIIGTKLDERQTKVVAIKDYRNEKLPAEITKNIQTLSQSLDNIQVDSSFAKRSLDMMGDGEAGQYAEADLQTVTQAQNEVIQNAVALFDSWTALQAKRAESRMTAAIYDAELKKLQNQLQHDMQAIDNKSAILREALKRINTSRGDQQQLREGLLALTDRHNDFTDQEWEEFFNGTKTIEI